MCTYLCVTLSLLAWGGVFLNGVEKRLEEMERTLDGLANHFLIGSTAHEGEAGGQPVAKGMSEFRITH